MGDVLWFGCHFITHDDWRDTAIGRVNFGWSIMIPFRQRAPRDQPPEGASCYITEAPK